MDLNMADIIIGGVCTVCGVAFSYASFSRHKTNDVKEDAETISKAVSELQYVARGVDDIKVDIRTLSNSLQNTNERVVKLEMGLEMTNKRIDDLGGR